MAAHALRAIGRADHRARANEVVVTAGFAARFGRGPATL